MKKLIMTAAAMGLAGSAFAGGIDRSGQSIDVLFEEGRHLEFSIGMVNPDVSGVGAGVLITPVTPTPGAASGDMAPAYTQFAGAYKADLNDTLSYAIIIDSPFGADVDYPAAPLSLYFAEGSMADLNTTAVTGLIKYRMDGFSVFGGVRAQSLGGDAAVPFVGAYSVIATDA